MNVTKEQIQEWKKKYGKVFKISCDGKVCYLKPPTRKILGYASVAGKEDPLKFNEVILRDCWLDGDEEIRTNDVLFLSVGSQLANIIQTKEAELEEL